MIEQDGAIAGCGGWSRRATLYGGDRSPGRDAALLDPASYPARVRAMYTHPTFVRRDIGRLILAPARTPRDARGLHPRRTDGNDGGRAALSGMRVRAG